MNSDGVNGGVGAGVGGVRAKDDFSFDSAVFAYYMEYGKPCTAKELAKHSRVSIGKVRKAIEGMNRYSICETFGRFRSSNTYQPRPSMIRSRIKELESTIQQIHKDYGCEVMDPSGTIWQHAEKLRKENEELRKENEELRDCVKQVDGETGELE